MLLRVGMHRLMSVHFPPFSTRDAYLAHQAWDGTVCVAETAEHAYAAENVNCAIYHTPHRC